jgi:hypothetical protein
MSDPGLSNRLRQHSRRSGLAVGLTMAGAIAICILTSAWLFGRIEPYVSDFTGYEQNTAVPAVAAASNDDEPTEVPEEAESDSPDPTEEAQPAESDGGEPTVAPAETATTSAFQQTHESNPDFTVNFRPGPSIDSGEPVATLDPGTPLQYLDEQTTGDDGSIWLFMKTQDGLEGWLREVDTVQTN